MEKKQENININTKAITANNNIMGDNNNGNGNINKNIIINKTYNLYPFAKDGIDCKSLQNRCSDSAAQPVQIIAYTQLFETRFVYSRESCYIYLGKESL